MFGRIEDVRGANRLVVGWCSWSNAAPMRRTRPVQTLMRVMTMVLNAFTE